MSCYFLFITIICWNGFSFYWFSYAGISRVTGFQFTLYTLYLTGWLVLAVILVNDMSSVLEYDILSLGFCNCSWFWEWQISFSMIFFLHILHIYADAGWSPWEHIHLHCWILLRVIKIYICNCSYPTHWDMRCLYFENLQHHRIYMDSPFLQPILISFSIWGSADGQLYTCLFELVCLFICAYSPKVNDNLTF